MKIRIEVEEGLGEVEVVIRCGSVDEEVHGVHSLLLAQGRPAPEIVFFKGNQEFYFPLDEVLFFETDGEAVYAHTRDDAYLVKFRLYALEETLPKHFARAAKATIVNTRQIYSITRELASASLVRFSGTHKQIYVSRHYYGALKQTIRERNTSK